MTTAAKTPRDRFQVYQDPSREKRGVPSWSFKLDGQPAMYWSPTRAAAERVIARLLEGRSREAFGGMGAVVLGTEEAARVKGTPGQAPGRAKIHRGEHVVTRKEKMKSGREKVREVQPGFKLELDGKLLGEEVATEAAAKATLAVEAFKTRGRLGKLPAAEEEFRRRFQKDCKAHQVGRRIFLKDEDGGLWLFVEDLDAQDGKYRYKQLHKDQVRALSHPPGDD